MMINQVLLYLLSDNYRLMNLYSFSVLQFITIILFGVQIVTAVTRSFVVAKTKVTLKAMYL